ncbi:hypothetical protein QBC38DRAFT_485184 [Podospora fimiseda]|uniref:LYR motif-containing protein Cup1-like N-terminal domain-containing protein n=1 Tax=Podospora fimiseda TaxID=252190 RepID=A0AAN7BJS5_9PEZI|nr:hypothetical protein QBC38DRAFT_485184 [Podospora fimiseda]
MSHPLRLPPPKTTLQIYRHLLRESSYLPSVVRPFVDKHIKSRFHKHQKDTLHVSSRTKKAEKGLRYLRAANSGDTSRMTRILLFAFGRIGPRRRELLDAVIKRPPPQNTEELEAKIKETMDVSPDSPPPDWLDNWDTDVLQALTHLQMTASPPNTPRPAFTSTMTTLSKAFPETNSWGEPWNPRTKRTKTKKYWKNLATRILPPVPKEEWETLEMVSKGIFAEAGWKVPARRTPIGDLYEPEWKWPLYATQSAARVDRPASRRFKLLTGEKDYNTPTGEPNALNCHRYTARAWRRLMMNIWRMTPIMEPLEQPMGEIKFDLKWGDSMFKPPVAVTAGEMEFFSGLKEQVGGKGGKRGKRS